MKSVLTEAEEECVHAHSVNAEESMSDEIGAHQHRLMRERKHILKHLFIVYTYTDHENFSLCRLTR